MGFNFLIKNVFNVVQIVKNVIMKLAMSATKIITYSKMNVLVFALKDIFKMIKFVAYVRDYARHANRNR
jgi:hypothetical protein